MIREGFDSSFRSVCELRAGRSRCWLGDVLVGRVPTGQRWQQWVKPTALTRYNDVAEAPPMTGPLHGDPGARVAHCISMDVARFRNCSKALRRAGFAVVRVTPVSTTDPRVLEMERRYRRAGDDAAGSPRKIISNLLTHVDLWRSRTARDWTYVFEDDALLLSHAGDGSAMQCLLARAEHRASSRNHSLLFLGSAAEHLAGLREPLRCEGVDDAATHTIRPCAPLSVHAYAFRAPHSRVLWALIRYLLHQWLERGQLLYRYNVDIALRAFYWRANAHGLVSPADEWPLCIDPDRHGLYGQAAAGLGALPHNWTEMRW